MNGKPIFDANDTRSILKNYNIANALQGICDEHARGYEWEISREAASRSGVLPRGLFVPSCVLMRALIAGDPANKGTTGANFVAEDFMDSQMIEALVARTILGRAGVLTFGGLIGNVRIPKGGEITPYWVDELSEPTETTPDLGSILATPHSVGSRCSLSHELFVQTSPAVQRFIIDMLAGALGRGIEAAILNGSGQDNQPTGLANTSGVQATTTLVAGAPTHDALVDMVELIDKENANGDALAFVGGHAVKAALAKTAKTAYVSEDSGFAFGHLYENGRVGDHPFFMSNLTGKPKHLIFGDWSQVAVCAWGDGIDVIADKYSASKSGTLNLVAFQDVDVVVRQPKAFVVGQVIADD